MPRIRSIHPGIFTDEAFMTASMQARVLIMGLWCEAHDDGVFEWKPLTLKVRLMPADNVDVGALLEELKRLNFIRPFEAKGKTFGVIRNFQKYQRPKKPNRSGVFPDELLGYARGDGTGSAMVEEEFGTGGELVPPGEEDGGGGGIGEEDGGGTGAQARSPGTVQASASPVRKGTDEVGPWLRSLVGTEPVVQDLRTQPIEELLDEGLTREDVEAGIAAAMADPGFRPRSWKSLVGWVRRAAKDRLEAAPKQVRAMPAHARPEAPRKPVTPVMIRFQQVHLASEHFRGHWSDAWPNHCRPGHPDCTTPDDVIEDARIAVQMESLPNPNIAREMGFAPDRFSRFQ